ncbi:MAG: TonB-dependent receptor [Steroidobacteraceae bacterium]
MNHISARLRCAAIGLFAAMATPSLQAADVAADSTSEREQPKGIEEIVVTARKREENVQRTPVSMVALSSEALNARSISSFKDLTGVAPNFEINGGIPNGGGSGAQLFIRGVGQDDYAFPNDPGVGLYIDGVYIARSAGSDFNLIDLDRVEVLRGPQGTLYGRNTIGGAVKIVTKKPDGTFGGAVSATTGSHDRHDFDAMVQFPISPELAGKLVFGTRDRNGLGGNFHGDDLGATHQKTARGALRFTPGDAVEIMVLGDWMRQRQAGPAGSMVYFKPNGATEGLINPVLAPVISAQLGLKPPFNTFGPAWVKTVDACGHCVYTSGGNIETRDWADIWGTSITADWKLNDSLDFKSISAFRHNTLDIRRVSDNTPFNIVHVDNPETTQQITQEFQVLGKSFDNKLDWVAGLFGEKEKGKSILFAPLLEGTFKLIGLDITSLINTEYVGSSYAAFGEGTWHFTDRLGMTLGGRFTKDTKEYTYRLIRPDSGVVLLPRTTQNNSWKEFLPKLGFEFRQTDDILWYTNLSRGYKSGGYNARDLSGHPPAPYNPEFINSFELGVKTAWLDRRLIANAAVFYNDYKDIQLLSVTDLGGGNVQTNIANAAKARIIGGEFEVTALPIPPLQLSVNVGTLDTKYKEVGASAQANGITIRSKLDNAPKLSLNAAATYTVPLGVGGDLAFRVDATHRSSQFRDAKNNVPLEASAYTLLNARISWRGLQDKLELAVFGTNLTDKLYITNGVEVLGLGYEEAYYNRPREWGASVNYRF